MDDWDSVSNDTPPDSTTDPWDSVSTPQPKMRKPRKPIKISISRRVMLIGLAGLVIITLAGSVAWFSIYHAPGIHITNTISTPTAQVVATVTKQQQIYNQATSGTLTFADPLSDDRNNWRILNTNWGATCVFTGGAYHLTVQQYWIWCMCPATRNLSNNFALQVRINIIKGNYGGILFGQTANNVYRIYVDSGGEYFFDGSNQAVQHGTSPAIKGGLNQANVVTVIVNNGIFYFYVNSQFVNSYSLSAYTTGDAALTAKNIDQPTDVAFSNLKIWKL